MKIDNILLPHSLGNDIDQVIVPAKEKIDDYLSYRLERLQQLLDAVKNENGGEANRQKLYEILYGSKGLTGMLVTMAHHNLELQIRKLIQDGLIVETKPDFYKV